MDIPKNDQEQLVKIIKAIENIKKYIDQLESLIYRLEKDLASGLGVSTDTKIYLALLKTQTASLRKMLDYNSERLIDTKLMASLGFNTLN